MLPRPCVIWLSENPRQRIELLRAVSKSLCFRVFHERRVAPQASVDEK